MKLFLCSSYITEEIKPDFESLINRSMRDLKIARIITGPKGYINQCKKEGKIPDTDWIDEDADIFRSEYGCIVDDFDIEEMTKEEREIFFNYDVIWIKGGLTGYLIKAIRKTGFEKELKSLLKEKIYIGNSAGSMICSQSLDSSEWYIGEPEVGVSKIPGLGFIDFQIYPHFKEELLKDIKKARRKDQEYWLLKNGQAVSIDTDTDEITICGGGIVKLEKEIN